VEHPEPPNQAPPSPASPITVPPSPPPAPSEPVLRVDDIQGNVLAGFNKDFQALLFLALLDVTAFRRWLATVVDQVATTSEVLAFNRLWKAMRRRRRRAPPLQAAWFNVGFSFAALGKLGAPADQFLDEAFHAGLASRSSLLGDPAEGQPGGPDTWCVGGPGNEADVVLIFATDAHDDLQNELRCLASGWQRTGEVAHGARLLHADHGATLPSPATGHEPFGFADGISQPGIRGRVSDDAADLLTPRQNPRDPNQGKPGQDLIWPGQFVFGYPSQDRRQDDPAVPGHDSLLDPNGHPRAPGWARDGSFLVVRRLLQHVPALRRFVEKAAPPLGLQPDVLEAKLIGRWKSGAPLPTAPTADDPSLGEDELRNNDFVFGDPPAPAASGAPAAPSTCVAAQPAPAADPDGLVCPLAAHIRKMNPRDDEGRFVSPATPADTRTRRILRRGIPFAAPAPRSGDPAERGLLFLAYQTSIVDQFEFLQGKWANDLEHDGVTGPDQFSAGHDPIIGRDPSHPGGPRRFRLRLDDPPTDVELDLPPWVQPSGGGYFFCPAIPALARLAAADLTRPR
jgi:Dyp-type peroxidase family